MKEIIPNPVSCTNCYESFAWSRFYLWTLIVLYACLSIPLHSGDGVWFFQKTKNKFQFCHDSCCPAEIPYIFLPSLFKIAPLFAKKLKSKGGERDQQQKKASTETCQTSKDWDWNPIHEYIDIKNSFRWDQSSCLSSQAASVLTDKKLQI